MALALYHPLGKAALVDLSGGVERDELAFLLPMAVAYVGFELFASRLIHAQQVILPYWLKDAGRKGWLTLLLLVRMSGFLRDQTPFLIALLLGYVLQAVWIWYRSRQLPALSGTDSSGDWPRRAMLKYSGVMLGTVAAQMAFGQLDILMVGAWLGLTAVAHYSIAFNFGIVVSMPMKAMNASLRPIIAKLVATESWEEVRTLGERSLQSQWLASGWIFLVALAVSPWAFNVLPANYQGGLGAVMWIAGGPSRQRCDRAERSGFGRLQVLPLGALCQCGPDHLRGRTRAVVDSRSRSDRGGPGDFLWRWCSTMGSNFGPCIA